MSRGFQYKNSSRKRYPVPRTGMQRCPALAPEKVEQLLHGAALPDLRHFIEATEQAKEQAGEHHPQLRLTRPEYQQLRDLLAPHLRGVPVLGLLYPSFNGVDIILIAEVEA